MAERDRDFETRDLPPGGILLFAVGLLVILGIFFLAMRLSIDWIWPLADTSVDDTGYFVNPLQPPQGPNLESNPQITLQSVLHEERTHLNSYGWVDRAHGVVHIPITRAMDLIAKRGLPKHPQAKHESSPEAQGKSEVESPAGAQPGQRPPAEKGFRPEQRSPANGSSEAGSKPSSKGERP